MRGKKKAKFSAEIAETQEKCNKNKYFYSKPYFKINDNKKYKIIITIKSLTYFYKNYICIYEKYTQTLSLNKLPLHTSFIVCFYINVYIIKIMIIMSLIHDNNDNVSFSFFITHIFIHSLIHSCICDDYAADVYC